MKILVHKKPTKKNARKKVHKINPREKIVHKKNARKKKYTKFISVTKIVHKKKFKKNTTKKNH